MNIKAIVLVFVGVLILSANVMASQPSGAVRNIDFNLQVLEAPEKVGDILRVSWSFILKESADPVLQRPHNTQESAMFAEAFLSGISGSEVIEGTITWRGEIEYGRTYEFVISSTVTTPGEIRIRPVVETYSEMNYESYGTRLSRNIGEVVTVLVVDDIIDHGEVHQFGTSQFQITTDLVPDEIKRYALLGGESTLLKVDNLRKITNDIGSSVNNSKQTWTLNGEFDYEDAFGGTSNPVRSAICVLYQWVGQDPYYNYLSSVYTDQTGGFEFYTDVDSVTVLLFAADSFSNVIYATDSCFDFSQGETYDYHLLSISLANPSHNDVTVPEAYTHIDDLSLSGVFHIQSVLQYAYDEIGFPDFEAPIYHLDKDECAEHSSFGRFVMDSIPGIQIRGSYDALDWDQWDTSVVCHELGHLYQWSQASMPPYSGGSHSFIHPAPDSGVHDLYMAWAEGWATFFSCRINNSPIYLNYAYDIPDTNIWINLEQPSPDVPYTLNMPQTSASDSTPNYEGAHVEGSIALALWDLFDTVDDGDYYSGQDIWGHNNDSNAGENWSGWGTIYDVFTGFDPQPDNTDHNNCWSIYEFIHGWRKLDYTIDAVFTNIFEAHAVPVFIPGDSNNDGIINIFDISFIISYLYLSGPAPEHMSAADPNADCVINLFDATYIQVFLYQEGPDPLVGCYNLYP